MVADIHQAQVISTNAEIPTRRLRRRHVRQPLHNDRLVVPEGLVAAGKAQLDVLLVQKDVLLEAAREVSVVREYLPHQPPVYLALDKVPLVLRVRLPVQLQARHEPRRERLAVPALAVLPDEEVVGEVEDEQQHIGLGHVAKVAKQVELDGLSALGRKVAAGGIGRRDEEG